MDAPVVVTLVPELAQILVDAALHREVDPVLDGPTRRILGRPAR